MNARRKQNTGLMASPRAARAAHVILLGALASAFGCSAETALPTSVGVNLTIRVDAGVRPQVHTVAIHVTGAEQFDKIVDITAFNGNEARVHYVPGVQAGVLTFAADALDAGGAVLAHASSGPVTLVPNQAVAATIDLAGAGNDGGADGPRDGNSDLPADALGPGKKGEPCGAGSTCRTGLVCADGVCCENACAGACNACNLVGREGTCSPVPAGTAPTSGRGTCGPDDPSTCQRDGTCDGMGACRQYTVGTTCRASKCDATTDAFTPEFKCDGKGVCDSNIAIPCAPFRCKDATSCFNTCTDGSQCVAGKTCVGGSCGLKGPGAACMQASECLSGFCADGVCCDRGCTAGCDSCVLPGKLGVCTPVPMGMDPKGVCAAGTAENAVCSPGGCDGTGGTACRKAATTVTCRVGSCVAGVAVNPATCQASGVCPNITQTPCGVYTCGATACNATCAGDGDCVMGYYCATNRTCLPKKTPGVGCAASNECQGSLTCLDGVCCMAAACPNCRNCGSDGTCSLTVGSAAGTADTTGNVCSGNQACNASGGCVQVNGQSCTSNTQCVSGNCIDGVCCSVASCGTCRNCGTTGTCSISVSNADDATGAACANDSSCDTTATCKLRWSLVGKVATAEAAQNIFTAGAGNFIYFANPSNSGNTQFIKSFNVTTNVFADQATLNNPLCACGYEGALVAQPTNGRVYYAANDARWFVAGATGWTAMGGTTYPARGESATAVMGTRIYYAGGRGPLATMQAYDTSTDTWVTTGLASAPMAFDSACAGAFGGVMYMFGGRIGTGMLSYTQSTNTWTTLPFVIPPASCYYQNLPVWRSKLVMADSQAVRVFNPTTQVWEAPVPLPALTVTGGWSVAVAGSAGDLYVLGWTGGQTSIYKWVFN